MGMTKTAAETVSYTHLDVYKRQEFDQAMSAASAASRATGTELEALRDLAMRLGKDTQ